MQFAPNRSQEIIKSLSSGEAMQLTRQLARRYPLVALQGVADGLAPAPLSDERRAYFIIGAVCALCGVTLERLRGRSRERLITEARQMAMCLVATYTRLPSPSVGRLFCRDHSTVLHAIAKAPSLPTFARVTREVTQLISQLEAGNEHALSLIDVIARHIGECWSGESDGSQVALSSERRPVPE